MKRAKTQFFGRWSSANLYASGGGSAADYDDNDARGVHHPTRDTMGSMSRIGLSMGLKGLLKGSMAAANNAPAEPPSVLKPRTPQQGADVFKWGKKRREIFGTRAGGLEEGDDSASLPADASRGTASTVLGRDAPPLRYSHADLHIAGWLSKRGKRLGSRVDRFFELNGSILSNARGEFVKPTWTVNVRGSKVLAGPGREIIFKVNRSFTSFFAPTDHLHDKWIKALQAVSGTVTDFYDFGRLIGRGAYSEVFIARDKARNELCAIKVLERSDADHAKLIDRELDVLKMLHHQNIVQIYDIFDSARVTYVVMEYLAGGELLDMITESDHLSERNAKQVIREVLQAVAYLHARGIVHRDVKPENILCVNNNWPLRVKLTDFGLSKVTGNSADGNDRVMRSQCGTAYYLSPEIANNLSYSKPVDLWACGVVLYVMLAGKFPFYGDTDEKFMRRLRAGVKFPEKEWKAVSADAKALVRGLLDPNPTSRLTAARALQHRWLVGESDVTASSMPTQAAGDARERRYLQYEAATEPLSLQLAQFIPSSARRKVLLSEVSENDAILRTDDIEAGGFGSVPAAPTPSGPFVPVLRELPAEV